MLVQEGALRAHNLLAPLLALRDPPPLVHKALAALHLGLQGVANLVQVGGGGGQHGLGGRVGRQRCTSLEDEEEVQPTLALGASHKLGAPFRKQSVPLLTPWSLKF